MELRHTDRFRGAARIVERPVLRGHAPFAAPRHSQGSRAAVAKHSKSQERQVGATKHNYFCFAANPGIAASSAHSTKSLGRIPGATPLEAANRVSCSTALALRLENPTGLVDSA